MSLAFALVAALVAPPPPPPSPADWPVSELVVAVRPGPVFWRVARGGAEVWVLGVPPVFVRGQRWETARLKRVLAGARRLITPVEYKLEGGTRPKPRTPPPPLEARLSPELAQRFASARQEAGQPADRYAERTILDAAYRIRADLYRVHGLTTAEPDGEVRHAAYWMGAREEPAARYAEPFETTLAAEPLAEACLEGALADAAFAREHAAAASRAWAVGNLAAVRENTAEPTVSACLDAVPSFAALSERSVADTAAAIAAALAEGGHSVAVLTLGTLIKRGGVLDRLRAAGAQVTAPEPEL